MPGPRSTSLKDDLLLLFVVLVWGLNFVVIKAVLAVMSPHVMNLFRLSASAVVLGSLYTSRQRSLGHSFFYPLQGYAWQILSLGFMGFFVYQEAFIIGLNNTAAGSAALIMASSPLWTAVVSHRFGLERLPRAAWIALGVILAGTILIVITGNKRLDFGRTALFGNAVVVLAAALWGSYTAFNRPVLKHVTPLSLTFFGLLIALPFLVLVALPELPAVQWSAITLWVWVAIFFSGGLSTGIAVVLWNRAVKAVGASHTAAYGNMVPFIALFSSYVFLGEAITPWQFTGGALILGGIILMRRARTEPLPV